MPNYQTKMEELLFDYGTTYKTDYRHGEIISYPKTVYKEKVKMPKVQKATVKDIHTLTEFAVPIPFDLFHKPKEIIRTNPWVIPQPCSRIPDLKLKEVQRTRPRLVMTPALSMDDIEDPHARDMLIQDVYISDAGRGQREAVAGLKNLNIRAPFPGLPAPAKPVTVPKLSPPVVPPEWRKDTLTWDMKQIRGQCNPTETFWVHRNKSKCSVCDDSAVVMAHRQQMMRMKGQRC